MKQAFVVLVFITGIVLGVALDRLVAPSSHRVAAAGAVPTRAAATPAAPPAAAPVRRVEDPKAIYRVPLDDSPVRGPRDALVTIVESSDFECPFCKRVAPTLKRIEEAYRGRVRFAFRHHPLSMHPNAAPAAMVAEEARAQGGDAKFWAMHDKLLELPTLDRAALETTARELGLSARRVKTALDTSKYLDRVRRDQNLAYALGATGTPSFFVNGRKIVGAQPFEAFKAVIDEEIEKAEILVKSGVAPRDVYARTIEKGATAP